MTKIRRFWQFIVLSDVISSISIDRSHSNFYQTESSQESIVEPRNIPRMGEIITHYNIGVSNSHIDILVNPEIECYPYLSQASGHDDIMDGIEYIAFVNYLNNGYFANVTDFRNLPFRLVGVFNKLACNYCSIIFEGIIPCCQISPGPQGTAFINITGLDMYFDEQPFHQLRTIEQLQIIYLFEICEETLIALKDLMTISHKLHPSLFPTTVPTHIIDDFYRMPSNLPIVRPILEISIISGIAVGIAFLGLASAGALLFSRHKDKNIRAKIGTACVPSRPPIVDGQLGAIPPDSTYEFMHKRHKLPLKGFLSLDSRCINENEGDGKMEFRLDSQFPVVEPDKQKSSIIESNSLESSSNAGSSGWSSSAGMSSQNTGSLDSLDYGYGTNLVAFGTMSGIGGKYVDKDKDSNFVPVNADIDRNSDECGIHILPQVSRADLESAIEAGDWAEVGATAAVLAQADSSSEASSYRSENMSGLSFGNSIDKARTTELEQILEVGDWEGIVIAASKFEAQSEPVRNSVSGYYDDGDNRISRLSGSSFSDQRPFVEPGLKKIYTDVSVCLLSNRRPSFSTIISDSLSKTKSRKEVRKEVEYLIKSVVPNEIRHIDEIMFQFHGREDKLLKMLRTMQKRRINLRSHKAMHRNIRKDTWKSLRNDGKQLISGEYGLPPSGSQITSTSHQSSRGQLTMGAICREADRNSSLPIIQLVKKYDHYSGISTKRQQYSSDTNGTISGEDNNLRKVKSILVSPCSHSASSIDINKKNRLFIEKKYIEINKSLIMNRSPQRPALQKTISARDWEAVGQFASMMVDTSESSVGTSELESLADSTLTSKRSKESTDKYSPISNSGMNDDQIFLLDKLIDKGDWSGIVAAASRYRIKDTAYRRKNSKNSLDKCQSRIRDKSNPEILLPNFSCKKSSWRKRFVGIEKSIGSSSIIVNTIDDNKVLQEENDSLAQADILMAVAAQSKNSG